jgi:hypothetical protein
MDLQLQIVQTENKHMIPGSSGGGYAPHPPLAYLAFPSHHYPLGFNIRGEFGMKFARTNALALPLLVTLALACTAAANANPVILNASFSGPVGGYTYQPATVTGWTFTGGTGVQANGSAWGFSNAPGSSAQSAFLQSYIGPLSAPTGAPSSSISQDVAGLTSGDTYAISFYLEQRPGYGANPVTVTIDGVTLTVATAPDNDTWTKYTEDFTYNGGSDVLSFSVTGSGVGQYDNDTGLADVSIAATPEPGTLLMLGTGLFGFAAFARRKFGTSNI